MKTLILALSFMIASHAFADASADYAKLEARAALPAKVKVVDYIKSSIGLFMEQHGLKNMQFQEMTSKLAQPACTDGGQAVTCGLTTVDLFYKNDTAFCKAEAFNQSNGAAGDSVEDYTLEGDTTARFDIECRNIKNPSRVSNGYVTLDIAEALK